MSPYRSVVFEFLRPIIKESDMFFMFFHNASLENHKNIKIITVKL